MDKGEKTNRLPLTQRTKNCSILRSFKADQGTTQCRTCWETKVQRKYTEVETINATNSSERKWNQVLLRQTRVQGYKEEKRKTALNLISGNKTDEGISRKGDSSFCENITRRKILLKKLIRVLALSGARKWMQHSDDDPDQYFIHPVVTSRT